MSSAEPLMRFTIRPATHADLDVLVDFQQRMAIETEDRALHPALIRDGLRRALDPDSGVGASVFVAECQVCNDSEPGATRTVAAGMMMTTSEFDLLRGGVLRWFQSVYVAPANRRAGIFRDFFNMLQRSVVESSSSSGYAGLRLDVDKTNLRAQATYMSLGMRQEPFSTWRWTAPGLDLLPLDADKNPILPALPASGAGGSGSPRAATTAWAKAELAAMVENPPPIAKRFVVRRLTKEDAADQAKLRLLAEMCRASAVQFGGAEQNASAMVSVETMMQCMCAIAHGTHGLRDYILVAFSAPEEEEEEALATVTVAGLLLNTFEHSDWRDSAVCNMQHFTSSTGANGVDRCALFAAFYHHNRMELLQSLVAENGGAGVIGGIRVPVHPVLDAELMASLPSLGLAEERYYWMIYTK